MKSVPRILIVEDEAPIAELIAVNLRHNGFQPIWAIDAETAQRELDEVLPDVILLDWMLPGESGLTLARRWRASARTKAVPILMLTARTETSDRVAGLDAGADDYLPKPFALDELLARLRVLLRRYDSDDDLDQAEILTLDDLRIDVAARRVFRGDNEIELSKTEFELLELLVRNSGIVLDHSMIYDRIWGYDFGPESKNLAVYIGYIRRKVDAADHKQLIHTVRGVGYTARVSN